MIMTTKYELGQTVFYLKVVVEFGKKECPSCKEILHDYAENKTHYAVGAATVGKITAEHSGAYERPVIWYTLQTEERKDQLVESELFASREDAERTLQERVSASHS